MQRKDIGCDVYVSDKRWKRKQKGYGVGSYVDAIRRTFWYTPTPALLL